jgi:Sec-independent protein secretion pathway component TatC
MSDKIKEMSFLDHLEELRWRLVKSAAAVLVFGVVAFVYKDFIFDNIILAPKQNDFITYRFFCFLSNYLNLGDELCIKNNFTLQNVDVAGQFNSHIMISLYLLSTMEICLSCFKRKRETISNKCYFFCNTLIYFWIVIWLFCCITLIYSVLWVLSG